MYNINVDKKIGDLIKIRQFELDGVYEVLAVNVSIYLDEFTAEEEVSVLIEAIDINDPLGDYYIIENHLTRLATEDEIIAYEDSLEVEFPPEEFPNFEDDSNYEENRSFEEEDPFGLNEEDKRVINKIKEMNALTEEEISIINIVDEARQEENKEEDNENLFYGIEYYKEKYKKEQRRKRTVDEVLDLYLDVKSLIEVVGPEEEYIRAIKNLEKELESFKK